MLFYTYMHVHITRNLNNYMIFIEELNQQTSLEMRGMTNNLRT